MQVNIRTLPIYPLADMCRYTNFIIQNKQCGNNFVFLNSNYIHSCYICVLFTVIYKKLNGYTVRYWASITFPHPYGYITTSWELLTINIYLHMDSYIVLEMFYSLTWPPKIHVGHTLVNISKNTILPEINKWTEKLMMNIIITFIKFYYVRSEEKRLCPGAHAPLFPLLGSRWRSW